mmetsp:Transcript_7809/g.20514  ORF Transcript_7809/g.20514 Transcript_7809/m.20514 type:complete len:214 (+) Transcript_7809:574-1215(+)
MTTMLSISNGSSSSTTRRSSSPLRQLSSGTNSSSNNNASLQLHCRLGQHLRRLQSGELRRSWHLHHLRRRRSLALVVVILRARVVERVGWGSSRLSFHLTTTSSSSSSNKSKSQSSSSSREKVRRRVQHKTKREERSKFLSSTPAPSHRRPKKDQRQRRKWQRSPCAQPLVAYQRRQTHEVRGQQTPRLRRLRSRQRRRALARKVLQVVERRR